MPSHLANDFTDPNIGEEDYSSLTEKLINKILDKDYESINFIKNNNASRNNESLAKRSQPGTSSFKSQTRSRHSLALHTPYQDSKLKAAILEDLRK